MAEQNGKAGKTMTGKDAAPAPTSQAAAADDGYGLEDIRTAKDLVGRLGADRLKGLIDVLAG